MIRLRAVQHLGVAVCTAVKGIAAVFIQGDDCRTCAVAEQHAGIPVCKVGDTAQQFACHNQGVFLFRHGAEQRPCRVHGIQKTGAGGADVKGKDLFRETQALLEQARL